MERPDYKSILVIVIGFYALSWLFGVEVLKYIALGVGLLSLISERIASWILWGWEKIALALGWMNTRILLSVIYVVMLWPIAVVSRLISGNKMKRKRVGSSTFTERNHLYGPKDLENIW